jgi:septal ring factor EnvC (AmiA/AmiB activator)
MENLKDRLACTEEGLARFEERLARVEEGLARFEERLARVEEEIVYIRRELEKKKERGEEYASTGKYANVQNRTSIL